MYKHTCLVVANMPNLPAITVQDALTAGLEAGFGTVVFDAAAAQRAADWQQLGRFEALTRAVDGSLLDAAGKAVGRVRLLGCAEDLKAAEKEAAAAEGYVVMDASDWQVWGSRSVCGRLDDPAGMCRDTAPGWRPCTDIGEGEGGGGCGAALLAATGCTCCILGLGFRV